MHYINKHTLKMIYYMHVTKEQAFGPGFGLCLLGYELWFLRRPDHVLFKTHFSP